MLLLAPTQRVVEMPEKEAVNFREQFGLLGRLMKFMPPCPENQVELNINPKQDANRKYHLLLVGVWAVLALACAFLLIQVEVLRFSVIYLSASVVHWIFPAIPFRIVHTIMFEIVFIYFAIMIMRRGKLTGFLQNAAMREEQIFREGSENWSWSQRAKSCLIFGAMHLGNFYVPLAAVIVLSSSGVFLMWVYLRTYKIHHSSAVATKESAMVHYWYNRTIIAFTLLVLTVIVIYVLAHIFI